jgi:hypothetical protein
MNVQYEPSSAPAERDVSFEELSQRWYHARRAALREHLSVVDPEYSEVELLREVVAHGRIELATKSVFDNSLRLGKGYVRHHGEITLGLLPALFAELRGPCIVGRFRACAEEPGIFFERGGCEVRDFGRASCAWYREAISGLVLGLTGGVLHTRYESVSHGHSRCLDVFYLEAESTLRFGPVPAHLARDLASIARLANAFSRGAVVDFVGCNESTIYYRISYKDLSSPLSVKGQVERALAQRLPNYQSQEISPRSVFGGQA